MVISEHFRYFYANVYDNARVDKELRPRYVTMCNVSTYNMYVVNLTIGIFNNKRVYIYFPFAAL